MLRIAAACDPSEYAEARRLFVEYAAQLGHDLCFQHFAEELENLPGIYGPPAGCLLMATLEADSVGCVGVRRSDATTCEMKRLYTRPEHRRQGIGRRLAVGAIDFARQAWYARMRLDTLESMAVPRALYQSLGFREVAPYYDNPLERVVFYELELTRL
jgi:putative acetyltransferase